ncbi:MAG: RCC1 domain-containing protein [Polyangiales bacterium]
MFDKRPIGCAPPGDLDQHPLTDVMESASNCLLKVDGGVFCWGDNLSGQLGVGNMPLEVCSWPDDPSATGYPCTSRPLRVPGLPRARHLSGVRRTCAVLEDRTVRCWGDWISGALDEQTYRALQPVEGLDQIVQIAVDFRSGCALRADGQVLCFGDNTYGEIGNGATVSSERAVEVGGLSDATEIAVGNGHACAVRRDRSLWCWGDNQYGQLGDGTLETRLRPVQTLPPGSVAR